MAWRSEEHTSELQSQSNLVCRLLLEKKKKKHKTADYPIFVTGKEHRPAENPSDRDDSTQQGKTTHHKPALKLKQNLPTRQGETAQSVFSRDSTAPRSAELCTSRVVGDWYWLSALLCFALESMKLMLISSFSIMCNNILFFVFFFFFF